MSLVVLSEVEEKSEGYGVGSSVGRAEDCGSSGRGFESRPSPQAL